MAYPIDPSQGFLRTPARYPHDAFGVDTGGRVRPHSGIDSTPTIRDCPARSVLGGTVVRADWTRFAGNYVVEAAPDGWLWLTLHLASRHVRPGAVTTPGQQIGVVGNTGGGGALKDKPVLGIHSHVSRCKDMAAVNRIINGLVRTRYKGETSAQWAIAHGLSDPYPHIIDSLKAKGEAQEDEMNDADRAWLQKALNDTEARIRNDMKANVTDQVAKALTAAEGARDALIKPVDGFAPIDVIRTHSVATLKAVREQAAKQGITLDEQALANSVLDQLGKRITNG